jgi:sulfur-oxidizing protein SoxY
MTLIFNRRQALALGAGMAGAVAFGAPQALAKNDSEDVIKKFTGGKTPTQGKIKLDLPEIAENGNTVPMTVTVESPMTEQDRVVAIHFLLEQNPEPEAAHFALGPRCGKAEVSTRLRMLAPQHVYGLAEMSDGSFWIGSIHVEVTLAACVEIDVK